MNNKFKDITMEYTDRKTGITRKFKMPCNMELVEEQFKEYNINLEILRKLMEIYYEYNDKTYYMKNDKETIDYSLYYYENTNTIKYLVYRVNNSLYTFFFKII